jgi:hypothetical protein
VRRVILSLIIVLIFGAFAGLFTQVANVGAVGAPSDNSTIPNFPLGEQSQVEIKLPVKYVLLGPTAQEINTPPNIVPSFIGLSEQDKFTVTAQENWYLQLDINAPGWLYIYEYFTTGEKFSGKWIAYKWQLPQSGIWKFGPFTAGEDEPEGQHIYRFWFFSDGLWAGEDPNTSKNILIYWTYNKDGTGEQPARPAPWQPPDASVKETTFLSQLGSFASKPLVMVLGSLIFVSIVVVGFYVYRQYVKKKVKLKELLSVKEETEKTVDTLSPSAASAKIALPNGVELYLSGNSMIIGRNDLARALDMDKLGLISRRHFKIKVEDEQFFIEDLDSNNGTVLNGVDISGKGPVNLSADDDIELAGTICLKFSFNNPPKGNPRFIPSD